MVGGVAVHARAFPIRDGDTAWFPDYDNSVNLPFSSDHTEVRLDANLEPGMYILVVGMFFEAGDVQYGVVLEVE